MPRAESVFEYDVFLSHSPKDQAVVREIAERLEGDGLRVWFDPWATKSFGNIPAKFTQGLEQSRVLVLCVSANSFDSDWAQFEANTIPFRDPLNMERRFVLMRLDSAGIKTSLTQFLFVDWRLENREQEYAKLLDACKLPGNQSGVKGSVVYPQFADEIVELNTDGHIYAYAFSLDQKRVLTSGQDNTIRLWDLETGLRLSTFAGHTDRSENIAWSPDERLVLGGAKDNVMQLWEVETGECIRVFEGHTEHVWGVTWNPDQRSAFSTSFDKTVRLWDIETGECLRVFKGHADRVRRVILSADQRFLLSCADDNTLRLWDVKSGECSRVLEGHTYWVLSIAWSANPRLILSGSCDNTMRLWDAEKGRCLRVFEGHTSNVEYIAWSTDQRRALSGSPDGTVRVWDVETGECLRVLRGSPSHVKSVAWSIDQTRALVGYMSGGIRIWDLSDLTTSGTTSSTLTPDSQLILDQVQYTNAKVLLVGDTGVGKSGLAERLIHNQFVPTKSSHGRQAHVLESKVVKQEGGVLLHRETVLWDLAGQPAYRSVHQLSMDEAALACVLFDSRSETNPFEGAAYWSQVLDQARTNANLKKILVASRIDVGGLPAGQERIEAFANKNGFVRFIATSASTGEGCADLLNAIRSEIPWDDLPTLSTTKTLAAMRDYVATLKGENVDADVKGRPESAPTRLLPISSLHEGFVALFGKGIGLDEFIVHLQRLEASDTIGLLIFHTTGAEPRAEDLVLLDPTRVDAYSSALLVAAKDEPDGPGHLLESRVREGRFKLNQDERIADLESERHVLWFVLEKLLSRDLALRERIKEEDYVVFPSQCTAELRFPGAAAFGVTFGFAGPVRSIYARLIAHLAHYEGLKKREFFQDAAAYHAETGGRCIIHLVDHGRAQGELEVFFDGETPVPVRQGFLEFIGQQLEAKSNLGSLTKRHAYHCANSKCRNLFEDRVVKARLEARRRNLVCPICEKKTPLINLLVLPTAAAETVAAQMSTDAATGRYRMTAALVVRAKEAEGRFDVFLSHNSKDKAAVEKIAKQLLKVGLRPWLDKWNLSPGDTVSDALEQAVKNVSCAALCFGPADKGKWHIMEIRSYVEKWANGTARMIPVLLPNADDVPELPLFVRQTLWVDMRDWEETDSDGFYRLVCGILGRAPGDSPMRKFGVRNVVEWQGMKS